MKQEFLSKAQKVKDLSDELIEALKQYRSFMVNNFKSGDDFEKMINGEDVDDMLLESNMAMSSVFAVIGLARNTIYQEQIEHLFKSSAKATEEALNQGKETIGMWMGGVAFGTSASMSILAGEDKFDIIKDALDNEIVTKVYNVD